MIPSTPQQDGVFGFWRPSSTNSEFNALTFMIQTMLDRVNTVSLARVEAVDAGAMTVDLVPLVNMVDGTGASWEHTTIYNAPFFRLQGGVNAVVCDPEVGDVGIVLFCDSDISGVKATAKAAPPNSGRKFDYADAIYLGGWNSKTTPTTAIVLASGEAKATVPVNTLGVYKVNGTQVVGPRQSNIAPLTISGSAADPIARAGVNAILNLLQAHGLMA